MNQQEKNFLGTLIIDNTKIISVTINSTWLSGKAKKIYDKMIELNNKKAPVDILTLGKLLPAMAGDIASLTENAHRAHFEYYQKEIEEAHKKLVLRDYSMELRKNTERLDVGSRELIAETEKVLSDISDQGSTGYTRIGDHCMEAVNDIEEAVKAKTKITGIETGFSYLDHLTCGFQPQELIIVGARPSVGKSAFATTLIANMAINNDISIGCFSLEMSSKEYLRRLISMTSGIESNRLRSGLLASIDFHNLTEAAGKIYPAEIHINDTPNISIIDLKAEARKMRRKENIKILYIDYLGLIRNEDTKIPRHEQMAQISRTLKELARELNIPVVALSQVGRQADGKPPRLSDLRETGAIEQDSDMVILLHPLDPPHVQCDIAKQRNGPTGVFKLNFNKNIIKFSDQIGGDNNMENN